MCVCVRCSFVVDYLPLIDEFITEGVTRATFHDVRFSLLVSQGNGRNLFGGNGSARGPSKKRRSATGKEKHTSKEEKKKKNNKEEQQSETRARRQRIQRVNSEQTHAH